MERRPLTELGVSALIAVVCVVFLVQALALPPGRFEPLGSGPVPTWTAGAIILCCCIVAFSAVRALARHDLRHAVDREFRGGNPMGGAIVLGLTFVYVGALHLKLANFGLLTFVYLALLILGLEGFARRRILPALILSAIAAFGAQYVFTEIFVVDLPA